MRKDTIARRLAKIERRAQERHLPRVYEVEVWGTRDDGTQYLIERYRVDRSGRPITEAE